MSVEKKVSIVIPVYNGINYLDQCIQSVVNQTYNALEIILVNDGSKDHSGIICDNWASKDSRIKVIHQENQGLSGARNQGTKIANGNYITYLDADDWFELNAIENAINKANESDYDLVFWQMIKEYSDKSIPVLGPFGEDKVFKGQEMIELHRRLTGPIKHELIKPYLIDSFASAWGKLYKLSLIKYHNIEFVDTKIIGSEDILFNFHYFFHCKSAYYLHKHLIHYRKNNPTSLTKTHGSTLFPRFLNLFSCLQKGINHFNLSNDFQEALNNRIAISMMNIGLSETSPKNSKSVFQQIKSIAIYLEHPLYKSAFLHLKLEHFKLHWKIFYWSCKKRIATLTFILLKSMRLFIR